jgi:hypothetical protein
MPLCNTLYVYDESRNNIHLSQDAVAETRRERSLNIHPLSIHPHTLNNLMFHYL